jgi:hypothetical protein
MLLRKCSLGVMLALALVTVTHADQPTLSIQQQATLVDFGVEVTVVVNCSGATAFEVNVGVRQGDMASESFGVNFTSSGGREVVPVFVPGVFTPGDADATAVLACNQLLEGIEAGQSIKIVE